MARNFNGSSYLQAQRIGQVEKVLGSPAAITLAAWVKLDAGGSGSRPIFSTGIGGGVGGDETGIDFTIEAANRIRAGGRSQNGDSFLTVTGSTALTNGVWTHVAAVIDYAADTVTVYVNGVSDGTGAAAFGASVMTVDFTNITIFSKIGSNGAATAFFNGDIADLAIFRGDASSVLASLVSGTRPDHVSGAGPCLYYPLDNAWDGKGVGHPRVGGVIMESLGGVTASADGPTLSALTAKEAWQKFDHQVRAMRLRASDYSGDGIGNTITARKMHGTGSLAAVNGTPTYQEVSGRSVIRFLSASSEYLSIDVGFLDRTRGFSAVILCNVVNGFRIFSTAETTVDETDAGVAYGDGTGLVLGSGSDIHHSVYTDYTDNNTALFSSRFSSSEIKNWLNGVVRDGTPTNATERTDKALLPSNRVEGHTTLPLLIARRHNAASNAYVDLDLIDMILVEGPLTDEEIQYLEGVIAHENAATNFLPADHPWKTTQPTLASDIPYQWGNAKGVIARSPDPYEWFLGSPGIEYRSNGDLICCHDQFRDSTHDIKTWFYVSSDSGDTWRLLSTLPAIWGRVWEHTDGNLYFLGTDPKYGNIKIWQSTNGGLTWSASTTLSNGTLLAAAGSTTTPPNYIGHSTKPLYHDGHIFIAHEDYNPFTFASGFDQCVLYSDATANLMDVASWSVTNLQPRGTTAFPDRTNPTASAGYLEGNLVVDDTGQMWNILRLVSSTQNKAVFVPIAWNGSAATFPAWDDATVKDMPGGNCKFEPVKVGSKFYAVTNQNTASASPPASNVWYNDQRNRAVLVSVPTTDLSTPVFTVEQVLIDEADVIAYTGHDAGESLAKHGFQYPAAVANGSTIHLAWRLGWSGAADGTGVNTGGNQDAHDANFIGYSQLSLTPDTTAPTLQSATISANGQNLILVFDEPVNSDYLNFDLRGKTLNVAGASGSGTTTLTIPITTVVGNHETLLLDYTG